MNQWLKLTEKHTGRNVLINMDRVGHVEQIDNCTRLVYSSRVDDFIEVSQTKDEIYDLLIAPKNY